VLYSEGIRCRVPTAEQEFAAARRIHGKKGAKRKAPATYELPEKGETAAYIRRARPNGRKYWAIAKDGETATHVRHEGNGYVDEIQAVHVIVSFGLDEVNPDDPIQVRRAFEFVSTMMTELFPGIQMKLVGQADGAGKAFHVHCVQNAVVIERMEVDGLIWEAGRKMSGALTDITRLRERVDGFIAQHGAEYGVEQKLPSMTEQKAETRNARDRSMAARGEISNHDMIRAAFEDAMDDTRAVHLDGFIEAMSEHGVGVNYRVTRAGKPNEKRSLSYRLGEMKTPVRGATLGDHYAYESAVQQLQANVAGLSRERRPTQQPARAPKPALAPTAQELADAVAAVKQLALDEQTAQMRDQMEADFFPSIAEDYDLAIEANSAGDADELARLAKATRDKRSQPAPPRAQGTTGSPATDAQASPTPGPQPSKDTKRDLDWKERARVALQAANSESQIEADRVIATHLREREDERTRARDRRTPHVETTVLSDGTDETLPSVNAPAEEASREDPSAPGPTIGTLQTGESTDDPPQLGTLSEALQVQRDASPRISSPDAEARNLRQKRDRLRAELFADDTDVAQSGDEAVFGD